MHELQLRGMHAATQDEIQICYKDMVFTEQLRFDLLVEGCLLIEIKAVQEVR
jgi:GxxExxY protein